MNERPGIKIAEGNVREISYWPPTGAVEYRELLIEGTDTSYILQVGTPGYVWSIRAQNMQIADPNLTTDENILPMTGVSSFEVVLQKLRQIPPENLERYLKELEKPDPAV